MSAGDELNTALSWISAGHRVALATVVDTWGSAPRPAGSRLVIRDDGLFVGSVSGGCVERAIVEEATAVLGGAPPRLVEFGVTNDEAWEVGLACGGRIRIFVEAIES